MALVTFLKSAGATIVLAGMAAAQGVAPEVLLLARIKSHLREELDHLPNYTCLATIARFHKEADLKPKVKAQLTPLDTVRLEVVFSNHREWFGLPGGGNFSADNPIKFIGSGLMGTGEFAQDLNNILEGATFRYRGEDPVQGRAAVKYDFQLARFLKPFVISVPGGSATVGEEGSLWVDPQSLDLIRLESRASEIPAYLPVVEAGRKVTYARTRIGEYNALLAQQGDLHLLQSTGVESHDRVEYTHCRMYTTQSAVSFDSDAQDTSKQLPAIAPRVASAPVPALLLVTVQLKTTITEKDMVGTLIEGKVAGDVRQKGKVVIASGSLVRGRIRRLERYQNGGIDDFIVGLEFTEVEANGGPMLFYADLVRIDPGAGIRPALSEKVMVGSGSGFEPMAETITISELPGVASFFVHGRTFRVPTGFQMMWRTRGPLR